MPYIKLRNNVEYSVSEDGLYLIDRHEPSGKDFWSNACTIPYGKKVVKFRETNTGANVEVLLNDNRWYKIDSNGQSLCLTTEEMEKSRKAEKAARNVKKEAESKLTTVKKEGKSNIRNGVNRAKSSINTFKNIDDSSEFEADANQIVNDYLTQQQNWMADADRQYQQSDRILQKLFRMRDAELHKLQKIDRKIIAKTQKRNIFKNLETIFKEDAISLLNTDQISQFIGIKSTDGKRAIARIKEEYLLSLRTEGLSDKFILCWSEIFYLIEEGIYFNSNLELISKLISKECGGSNVSGLQDDDNFEGFLKFLYSKVPYAYWGNDLEKLPYEDKVKPRIDYLTRWIPSDDESYTYDTDLLEVLSNEEIVDGDEEDLVHNFSSSKRKVTNNDDEVDDVDDDDYDDDDDDVEIDEEAQGNEYNLDTSSQLSIKKTGQINSTLIPQIPQNSQNLRELSHQELTKKKLLSGLMAIFFGGFGVQYFILGKIRGGIITIFLYLATCGLWYFVTLIQGILILSMNEEKFRHKYLDNSVTMPLF